MSASEQRLYFLLQLAAHRLKKAADTALAEVADLTTSQAATLTIIASKDGVTQKYLADQLAQRESAIAAMANRLIEADLISRTRSATDGRAWELRATRKGRTALKKISEPFGKLNAKLDESLKESNVERLADDLRRILFALEK